MQCSKMDRVIENEAARFSKPDRNSPTRFSAAMAQPTVDPPGETEFLSDIYTDKLEIMNVVVVDLLLDQISKQSVLVINEFCTYSASYRCNLAYKFQIRDLILSVGRS